MKIEMGESLAHSFLRHVKQCWLVQTNWKASDRWRRILPDDELESLFAGMRERFDADGLVFGKTKNAGQFLKQAEIDVLGVGQNGSVHALDVAFHEAGLNYGGDEQTRTRVLKKSLRSMLILKAYLPADTPVHVYFVSPQGSGTSKCQTGRVVRRAADGLSGHRLASADQHRVQG